MQILSVCITGYEALEGMGRLSEIVYFVVYVYRLLRRDRCGGLVDRSQWLLGNAISSG